jgi:hypothetical protein
MATSSIVVDPQGCDHGRHHADAVAGPSGPHARTARAREVWDELRPLLHACQRLAYTDETGELAGEAAPFERHYFVFRLAGWKLDISVWTNGSPEEVERHQEKLRELDASTRLAILRIKDARHRRPDYPEVVGGLEVYEAVLEHGVRTAEEFEMYLGRGRQR